MNNLQNYYREIIASNGKFMVEKDTNKFNTCTSNCKNCLFSNQYSTDQFCEDVKFNWLFKEYDPQILTTEEKAYLKSIVSEFKSEILYIEKITHSENYERLRMELKIITTKGATFPILTLQPFLKDTMFTGMKLNKEYKIGVDLNLDA